EVLLRVDQVVAARKWGIGFTFLDAAVSDRVTTLLAHHSVEQLAYDLVGLEQVQRRLADRRLVGEVNIVPPQAGRGFEQLMLDLLNEHYPCARQAPIYEDFFEKTDLRLHVRGLRRRRGARAQVTRTVDPEQHAEKLAAIHNVEEFVILSPLALARAVEDPEACGLSKEDLLLLWQCFPEQPTTEIELAAALRDVLVSAMAKPATGPRGPLAGVPEPIRLLVQGYAHAESFRATKRMRQRLAGQRQRRERA
ncbi:MAG TPA: hypothetical protein VJP77_08220, partial [Planctomycetota bacterium]|nr:hypothetical protein [Planctomycetota bacterium]